MEFRQLEFKKIRESLRWNTIKLAGELGVTRQSIYQWEKGLRIPSEKKVRQIAEIMDIDVRQISNLNKHKEISKKKITEAFYSKNILMESQHLSKSNTLCSSLLQTIKNTCNHIQDISLVLDVIFNNINTIIYVKDQSLNYIMCSKSFIKTLGLNPDYNIKSKTDHDIFSAKEAKLNQTEDFEVLATGTPILNQKRYIPGTMRKKLGLISKVPIFDNDKKIIGVLGIFTDITSIQAEEEKSQALISAMNKSEDFVWVAGLSQNNISNKIFYNNKALPHILGEDINEIVTEKIPKWIEENEMSPNSFNTLINSQDYFHREFNFKLSDPISNRIFFLHLSAYKNKKLFFGTIKNVTKQKESDNKISLLKKVLNNANDCARIIEKDTGKLLYISKNCDKIFGYPQDHFYKNTKFSKYINIHPDDKNAEEEYASSNTYPAVRKYRIIKNNNISFITETVFESSFDNKTYLFKMSQDTTENQSLIVTNNNLESILNSCSNTIVWKGITTKTNEKQKRIIVNYITKNVEDIIGYSRTKFYNQELTLTDLIGCNEETLLQKTKNCNTLVFDHCLSNTENKKLYFETKCKILIDDTSGERLFYGTTTKQTKPKLTKR